MLIFPAIDLYEGKAVRLFKGDYKQMTVYSERPYEIAEEFEKSGAKCIHIVDLQGAKDGTTPNFEAVRKIIEGKSLFSEIGGGIRSLEVIEKYLNIGCNRVILGTAAVTNPEFLKEACFKFGDKIALGVDIKDGKPAIKGWTETIDEDAITFLKRMENIGVKTVICTDISKDGAMKGTNHDLYDTLSKEISMDVIASGGVSSIEDVKKLADKNIYGAIIGKAYYTGAINLKEALKTARGK